MRDANEDGAAIGQQIVDTIRNGDADGIGTKVVIVHTHGRTIPPGAVVFEVADQFSFFGVHADNWIPPPLKVPAQ